MWTEKNYVVNFNFSIALNIITFVIISKLRFASVISVMTLLAYAQNIMI